MPSIADNPVFRNYANGILQNQLAQSVALYGQGWPLQPVSGGYTTFTGATGNASLGTGQTRAPYIPPEFLGDGTVGNGVDMPLGSQFDFLPGGNDVPLNIPSSSGSGGNVEDLWDVLIGLGETGLGTVGNSAKEKEKSIWDILVPAISAGVPLIGALIGSRATGKASNTLAQSGDLAAALERQSAKEALDFAKQVYGDQQANMKPWLDTGRENLNTLATMMKPGGELAQPFSLADWKDPGFDFRLQEGQKALERSAASRGNLLSGGTAKALQQYGQNTASDEYNNAFNRYQTNTTNRYNRIANIAGLGQTAANQLNAAGSDAANRTGNILMGSAAQIGDIYQNVANARASGYMGGANIWANALGNTGNTLMDLYTLSKLGRKN